MIKILKLSAAGHGESSIFRGIYNQINACKTTKPAKVFARLRIRALLSLIIFQDKDFTPLCT